MGNAGKIGTANCAGRIEGERRELGAEKKVEEKVYNRYYHLFKESELEKLIMETNFFTISTTYYDHENWCAECLKI